MTFTYEIFNSGFQELTIDRTARTTKYDWAGNYAFKKGYNL